MRVGTATAPIPPGVRHTEPNPHSWRTFTIHEGEVVTWPVGDPGVEELTHLRMRWVFTWNERDVVDRADVVIQLWNTCPSDGGRPELVREDLSSGLRKAVTHAIFPAPQEPNAHEVCLEMRAVAMRAPAGGIKVYTADRWHP